MQGWLLSDPKAALAHTLGFAAHANLPKELLPWVEEPFSLRGNWQVLPDCQNGSDNRYSLRLGTLTEGRDWQVTGHGWRMDVGTKEAAPLQGVRLENVAAIRDEVFQPVSGADLAEALRRFPVANVDSSLSYGSNRPLGLERVATVAGGKVFWFADADDLELAEQMARQMELLLGTHTGARQILQMSGGDGTVVVVPPTWDDLLASAELQASTWTETPKSVLCVVVDFPDKPGAATDANGLTAIFNTSVRQQIQNMSYGKTTINATACVTPILRMSQNSTFFTDDTLHTAAMAAAQAAGMTPSNFNIRVVYFDEIGMGYAGLATVGGSRMWLQQNSTTGVIVHELGHNYGLGHAHFWTSSDGSLTGVGATEEYGDIFDVMGSGAIPQGHFHAQGKNKLNWLTSSEVVTTAVSGLHRLHPVDNPATTSGIRGLRITRSANNFLWAGYRQQFTGYQVLKDGICLNWQKSANGNSWLVDTTHGSADGKSDAGVAMGRTYSDSGAGIHITPVAKGGSGASEYIDVQVNVGSFPNNAAPVAAVNVPSALAARTSILISATASDPDNDPLAYHWNLGDGLEKGNVASLSQTWLAGGTYNIGVTVSDMKGRTTLVSQNVTVSDPLRVWFPAASGVTSNLRTGIYNQGRWVVAGRGRTLFSTDGQVWTNKSFASSNQSINDITTNGTVFVGAGDDYDFSLSRWIGTLFISLDGLNWSPRPYPQLASLRAACHGAGVFLVSSEDGKLLRSTDGESWTVLAPDFGGENLDKIAYGSGWFVGVTGSNKVFRSSDGLNWQDVSSETGIESWHTFNDVVYNDGIFIAGGWYSHLRRSTDGGLTWQTGMPDSPDYDVRDICSANGVFLARVYNYSLSQEQMLISIDGLTWQSYPAGSQPKHLVMVTGNNRLLLMDDDGSIDQSHALDTSNSAPTASLAGPSTASARELKVFTATASDANADALTYVWEWGDGSAPEPGPATKSHLYATAGSRTITVTVTDGLGGLATATHAITVNDTVFAWTPVTSGTTATFYDAAASPTLALVVGNNSGTVMRSADGLSWTAGGPNAINVYFYGVCWTGSFFIACGMDYDFTLSSWVGVIYTSQDGVSWTRRLRGGHVLRDAATDGTKHVVVGDGGRALCSTSADGSIWTAVTVPEVQNLERVIHSGSSFVTAGSPAAGTTAKVWRSADGQNWVRRNDTVTSAAFSSLSHLAWLNGGLYAVHYSAMYASADEGLTWQALPTLSGKAPNAIGFGNGIFLAVNNSAAPEDLLSLDGRFWHAVSQPGLKTQFAAIFFKSRFITAGMSGSLRVSGIVPARPEDLPSIQQHPQAQTVIAGQTATLSVTATSPDGGALLYKWRKNTSPIPAPAGTGSVLTLSAVQLADEGSYDVEIINNAGSRFSDTVMLSVLSPPVITQHPAPRSVSQGQAATFSVQASGRTPMTCRWQKNEEDIPDETSLSLTIASAQEADRGSYRAVLTNANGTATSDPALLSVALKPEITQHPQRSLVNAGTAVVTFTVDASSETDLTYRWRKNGAFIPGATGASLTLTNIGAGHAAAYDVVVTNDGGTETSNEARLGMVEMKPAATLVLKSGVMMALTVVTSGPGIQHTWRRDGQAITTGGRFQVEPKKLTVSSLTGDDSGVYDCLISNGAAQGIAAAVTTLKVIDTAPQITSTAMTNGMIAAPYSFQIECAPELNRAPASFSATGVPSGLVLNTSTGRITGTPKAVVKPGTLVKVTAKNLHSSHTVSLPVTISALPPKAVGSFIASLPRDAALNNNLGGRLEITSTPSGILSGKLLLGVKSHAFSAAPMSPTLGNPLIPAAIILKRTGTTSLILNLTFDVSSGEFTGTLRADGEQVVMPLRGWRNPWHATTNPATAHAGLHNLGLRPPSLPAGDESRPRGHGYGSFTIAKTGLITLAGRLPDGSTLRQGGFSSTSGEVVLWQLLHNGGGSALGSFTITAGGAAPAYPDSTLAGSVSWFRQNSTVLPPLRTYSAGFLPFDLTVFGGKYATPGKGQVIMGLPNQDQNGRLAFSGAGLIHANGNTPDLTLSLRNTSVTSITTTVKLPTSNPAKIRLSLNSTTGAFSGAFTLLGPTSALNRSPAFQGLIVREGAVFTASGWYLLPQLPASGGSLTSTDLLSGEVRLLPVPGTMTGSQAFDASKDPFYEHNRW